MKPITITKFSLIILAFTIGFGFFNINSVFAIEFLNHTSEKFNISFEYPVDWTVKEPTSRFDDQKITLNSPSIFTKGQINIAFYEDMTEIAGSNNIQTTTKDLLDDLKNSYTDITKVIEKISSLKIGGEDTRTFVISSKDRIEKTSNPIGSQIWIVFTEKDEGYLIMYMQAAYNFDKPESKEIRDHFINSIKFLK